MIDSTKLTCTYETRPLNCSIKSDFSSQLKDLGERKGVRVATAVIIQYMQIWVHNTYCKGKKINDNSILLSNKREER